MERWQLIAGYVPPPLYAAAIALALALALAELAYTLRRKRPPLRPSVRVALVGLRLVAILGLIAIALELELAIDTVSARGPRIVVLVDRSASMALADRYPGDAATTARIERARSFWSASQPALDRWRAAGAEVEVMGFGDDVERLAGTQAAALEVRADRPASDLTRALSRLGGDATGEDALHDPRPLAGVIVISDGLVAEGDSEAAAVTRVAAQLDVPVTTVSAGAPELRDVAITEVRAGEFAFVENVSEIEATLVAHGLSGRKVEVTLLRDG
ncbi:MAG: VWA domain-containing protein, partial [Myxococcales bacterium]|nr:VWA domain-containing protein [Myxococcales bacterium]